MAERALSAGVLAAIASGTVRPFLLFEGEYSSGGSPAFLRLFTGVGVLSWDGKDWVGGRDLLGISPIRESTSLEAIGFSVRLSGLPTEKLSVALQGMKKNRPGKLWLGFVQPAAYLSLPGTLGNYASTPDSAANSITGDIDIRIRVSMTDWTPAGVQTAICKYVAPGNQRAYFLNVRATGLLEFGISTTGADLPLVASDGAPGFSNGTAHWLRVTRVQSSGVVTFYTSEDGIAWTPLGTTKILSAGNAIFNSTAVLQISSFDAGAGSQHFNGNVYYAEIRNGIDGPVVAKFEPLRFSAGVLTATAETGEVWTINQSGSPAARIVPLPDEVIPDPYPLRRGRFDVAPIARDVASGTMAIEARYEGPLARLLVPVERHYTREDQQLRLAGDRGFDQVPELQDANDIWGNEQAASTPPRYYWPSGGPPQTA